MSEIIKVEFLKSWLLKKSSQIQKIVGELQQAIAFLRGKAINYS
ncbi:hypothetical protein Riv7116_4428 [Rivularia sp. PCC 7116]|nr:hypothetical protein [Rivularia sp. PCC 7116]AFY56849.1 hypothetical protein Riv7116_4428 [Rivularia sp. PCC 7116]